MAEAGIDVGKASLDLAVDGQIEVARYPNTPAGITKVIRRLQALKALKATHTVPAALKNRCWKPAAMPVCGLRG